MKQRSVFLYLLLFICGQLLFTQASYAKSVGKVVFPISCQKNSQREFNDAVALVHNMMYVQAEHDFEKITKSDPNCAMGYWGIALTQIHPLWAQKPTTAIMIKGDKALQKARALNPPTKRERAYITALQPLYTDWKTVPYAQRIKNWELAQYKLHQEYPNDADATALYALAHLATAPKADKTYKHQKAAGALLEKLHAKRPNHPAGYHYTIHAYDNPPLAHKAEKYARGYDKIAPDVPHALHMPTHIFVRLGLWPETIKWNIRSAAAAKRQALKGGVMPMHYVHALDYLMYAYLQQAQDKHAKDVLAQLDSVKDYQDSFATAYGIAATRARYYLEQHLWQGAAELPLAKPENFPWDKYPAIGSITYFAKGLGDIKTGQIKQAQRFINKLNVIYNTLTTKKQTYWAVLVDSKRKTLLAWMDYQKGKTVAALNRMKTAADLEDSVDKHPVTPGEILPARELYGDMLLLTNEPKAALTAYQAMLKISPNRYNSVYGAGLAAQKLGDKQIALRYYNKLIKLTKDADTDRPGMVHAKKYIQANKK